MASSFSVSDELLSAYLDREISEAELRRVESALAADPHLQERLQGLQQVVLLLQNAPAVVVPRPLTLTEEQVLAVGASVRGVETGRGWLGWLARLMPMATAVVAVLFVLSFAWPMTQTGFLAEAPVVEMESMEPEVKASGESESGMSAMSREMGSGAALVPTSTMAAAASARAMPRDATVSSHSPEDVSESEQGAMAQSDVHGEEHAEHESEHEHTLEEERAWALWASEVSPWTKGLGLLLLVMVGISGWVVWRARG